MDEIEYQMKIKELEQTIENLKCCGNCGHYVNEYDEECCNLEDNTGCKYGSLVINGNITTHWQLEPPKENI